ncbi:MAG: catalase/peroxidase HPI [Pseudomonadota bacterium]
MAVERIHPAQCPVTGARHTAGGGQRNRDWWPSMLNLDVLRQHSSLVNPMEPSFDYAKAFKALDLQALKDDLHALMTDSKPWWPADYGHYGPFFIRMAWHVAGTYRTGDGRGGGSQGLQRFAPTNSWPDNANLDKARRLLWPIKKKYGRSISWADLFILAGNVAHESMGFKVFGFGGGREDVWQPAEDIYWGEEAEWLGNEARFNGNAGPDRDLERPLAAVHMGLIYVNPQGPNGNPDPLDSAKDIRETFARMAMNDEETVALIAGGHTFGKCHGAAPDSHLGPEPNAAGLHEQGLGWTSGHKTGHGVHTITSGLEGAWTPNPIAWDSGYFDMLFGYEWKKVKSPAGAWQWQAIDVADKDLAPEVDGSAKKVPTMMLTTDIALREDPVYREIALRFHKDHDALTKAYAKAWYKLTHRDMGPIVRYLGEDVPREVLIWQDPLPKSTGTLSAAQIADLKTRLLASALTIRQLITTAWASASTFRDSDKRGGANGARIRLAPQKDWQVNQPQDLTKVLAVLEGIQSDFGKTGSTVSLADLIVLGGCVAIEKAAHEAGFERTVPFRGGRVDAEMAHTDAASFEPLEPETDGFRNFAKMTYTVPAEALLVDRAQLLRLSAPEMTVLLGGLRVLGANHPGDDRGVLTDRLQVLSNDFFVNLLDPNTTWQPQDEDHQSFQGAVNGQKTWTASRVDLIFGHNPELRALAEVYAADDAGEKMVDDFIAAWVKVMELDRFDLEPNNA